jgi:thiol:disulfide interchange protein DsbA
VRNLLLSLSLVLLVPLTACAQDIAYQEGVHYDVISPALRARNPEKIEVVEFFWYGCGHCYNFEPLLARWKKTLAEDVDFVGSPAIFRPPMDLHAKAYYTAQALGVLDTMHPAVFAAMNVDRKPLSTEGDLAALFEANGVPVKNFVSTFNSFGINSQMRQADARWRSVKISGTPELLVAGKYRITTGKAGSQAGMLKIADYLIDVERAARQQ